MVLNWIIFYLSPDSTITNYVKRVGDLQGLETVIVATGGDIDPFNSQDALRRIVPDARGWKRSSDYISGGKVTGKTINAASGILP